MHAGLPEFDDAPKRAGGAKCCLDSVMERRSRRVEDRVVSAVKARSPRVPRRSVPRQDPREVVDEQAVERVEQHTQSYQPTSLNAYGVSASVSQASVSPVNSTSRHSRHAEPLGGRKWG